MAVQLSRRQFGFQFGVVAGAALAAGLAACESRENESSESGAPTISAQSMGYTVNVNKSGAPGHVFFVSGTNAANPGGPAPGSTQTPAILVIADKAGKLVWAHAAPAGQSAGNLRMQSYQGKPVLTWWQGKKEGPHGFGANYIADQHYNVIHTVKPGGGLDSDIHEFRLSPDGRALITSYQQVTTDLTGIGGPVDGKIFNCIASVVDVASEITLFQWDALSHVPVTDSSETYSAARVLDPYHMNSISLDPAGNLVISMRAVSTVFNVDPRTGAVNWQLGGKHSTFALGDGVEFSYQHDAQMPDANTVTLFDNHSEFNPEGPDGPGESKPSSLKWINIDTATRLATLVRAQAHPMNLYAGAMGNLQQLPGGNTFSGWGSANHLAEFAPNGDLVFDATLRAGTYRAYLDAWTGDPSEAPRLVLEDNTAHAIWNGATAVTAWRLLYGEQSTTMATLTTVDWAAYDTPIPVNGVAKGCYQLEALDSHGVVVRRSQLVTR